MTTPPTPPEALDHQQVVGIARTIRDLVLSLGEISASDLATMEGVIATSVRAMSSFPTAVQSFLTAGYFLSFVENIDIEDPPEAISIQALFAISVYLVELLKVYEPLDPTT